MRMLCWPARSPFKTSNRFPGGTRRSFSRPAISSCLSLRRATVAILANRRTCNPFESASVSAHLNVLITDANSNATHDYRSSEAFEFPCCPRFPCRQFQPSLTGTYLKIMLPDLDALSVPLLRPPWLWSGKPRLYPPSPPLGSDGPSPMSPLAI
jgi:hypothetical protein